MAGCCNLQHAGQEQIGPALLWWDPDAEPTLSAEADVRPGGRFSVVFRLLNGEEHNPSGGYQEVIPGRKLVEHLPGEEARKSHEEGWRGFLDELQVFLGGPEWPT